MTLSLGFEYPAVAAVGCFSVLVDYESACQIARCAPAEQERFQQT